MEPLVTYVCGFYRLEVRLIAEVYYVYVYSTFMNEKGELVWVEECGIDHPTTDAVKYHILKGHIRQAGFMTDNMTRIS